MEDRTYYEQKQRDNKVIDILSRVAIGLLVVVVVFFTLSIISLISG